MKNKFFFLIATTVAASLLLASCAKEQNSYEGPVDFKVSVTTPIQSSMIETKAAGDQSTNDVTIKNMQVFVFDKATGQIDNCAYEVFSSPKTTSATLTNSISCTPGTKIIWALANWPEDLTTAGANVVTVADLKSRTAALSGNAVDALLMTGYKDNVTFNSPSLSETVSVSRLCAAVVVKSVINKMLVSAYQNNVAITGAFLMNVPAIQNVEGSIVASSGSSPVSNWMAMYARPTSELLNESFAAVNIPYNTPAHTTLHTFYTFANDYDAVLGDGSAKSSTYLKVELNVNGTTYYYPVLMPALERNKKYEVTLTVNHISGITDPTDWKLASANVLTPTISVSGWTTLGIDETI